MPTDASETGAPRSARGRTTAAGERAEGTPPPPSDIVLVPHTHWDREWYEPHEVFRLRLVHVLDELLERMDADPGLAFTLDGQSAAIEDYLAIRPGREHLVRRLVERGQLALGPFLILLDEFCCDGETIVRNLELGIASARRLGGEMPVGYLPDMFGHAAQMPQLLRGFGICHAALWRGVPDEVREHGFAWVAPDGSAVRCEYLFDSYGSALDLFASPGRLGELAGAYRAGTRSWYGEDPVLGMLGTDHMAPWPDLMDRVRAHNATDAPALGVETLWGYLRERPADAAALAALRAVPGELRSHARGNLLPGVFSIRTTLKQAMGDAEVTLTRAERLDALYGSADHRAFFDLAWRRVVESTAHDSITGCGVDATAEQVRSRLESAQHIGRAVVEQVAGEVAAGVPSDAFVLLNTLPWRRPLQAEVTVAGEEPPAGAQVVAELETVLGDETMRAADLVRILRRIHGRELFGQLITSYAWGEGTLRLEVAEVAEGPFDLATLTAEVADRAAGPERDYRVLTVAAPRRRVLVEAEVPALGHVAVRPGEPAGGVPAAAATAEARLLRNGLVEVVVADDGTLTVTGADGTVLAGVGRLVDGGDRGDAYNHGPVGTGPVEVPTAVRTRVVASGPLRASVEVERTYDLPEGLDPADPDARARETAALVTLTTVELRRGEPFVRLTVAFVNTVRDHRLRLHVPLGRAVDSSASAGQFSVTRRGRTAEGGWGEHPLPTFPATGFVSAGDAHVLTAKLTEYEVVTPGDGSGDELALTLLRAVGMMSVNVHPLRDEPAGSQIPVPGAQEVGTRVVTRLAVLPHAGGWERAGATRWAEVFRHDAVVARGGAPAGGALPAPVAGPALIGEAVLTGLRRVDGGLEARVLRASASPGPGTLGPPPRGTWSPTDLAGRAVACAADDPMRAWEVRTLRTGPAS